MVTVGRQTNYDDSMTKLLDLSFKDMPSNELLMGVFDVATGSFVEVSPAADFLFSSHKVTALPHTISVEQHLKSACEVVEKKSSCTDIAWVKYDGFWHKLAITKAYAGLTRVLVIGQDITHLDPRAEWLARINLESQRLELDNGKSFSFDEFAVLHLLLTGYQYRQIAEQLKVSPKTVEYRLSRLKVALEADTTTELMLKIAASGLIHLVMVPTDPDDPAMTEVELYKRIKG
jgi:DNA-binding CsgD family transcriptional regulator